MKSVVTTMTIKASSEKVWELIAKGNGLEKWFFSHRRCIEQHNKYILLAEWKTLEDHTKGFRESEQYKHWKDFLHHYYDPEI